jgi:hypothetical protein
MEASNFITHSLRDPKILGFVYMGISNMIGWANVTLPDLLRSFLFQPLSLLFILSIMKEKSELQSYLIP